MSKKSSFVMKNHFDAHDVKTSFGLLESKFGISSKEVADAVSGNEAALQKIGQANKVAEKVIHFMPKIASAMRNVIKGTEVFHKEMGSLAQQAATATTSINSSINSTIHANKKYINQLDEQKQAFIYQNEAEQTRHENQTDFDKLKYNIDKNIIDVDYSAKVVDLNNRPALKQLSATQAYEMKRKEMLLEHGDEAPVHLISNRQYQVNEQESTQPKPKNITQSWLRSLGIDL